MARKETPAPPAEESEPTQRMVLQRQRVLVLPEGADTEAIVAAHKALGGKGAPEEIAAWIERGVHPGSSKDDAIEAYAGKAGTPDAKPGVYKAVPVKSFAGGCEYKAPPKPLIEKTAID